jgi:hypothetical protein
MDTRQWSSGLNLWLQNASEQKRPRRASRDPCPVPRVLSDLYAENIFKNVVLVLEQAPRGVWLRILPEADDKDSIYYASTGQCWSDMLACMLHEGLIVFSRVNFKLSPSRNLWEALGILHDMGQPYELGTARKNKSKAYSLFVCVGKPIYKRPNDQLIAKGCEVPPAKQTSHQVQVLLKDWMQLNGRLISTKNGKPKLNLPWFWICNVSHDLTVLGRKKLKFTTGFKLQERPKIMRSVLPKSGGGKTQCTLPK